MTDQQAITGPLRRVVVLKHGDHIGQQGTPEGGSQPGYTHVEGTVEGSAEEYERRLSEGHGEATWENWEAAAWIGPSGKLLAPGADHQETAMELLRWGLGLDHTSKEWQDLSMEATDAAVEAGLVRFNTSGDSIFIDIPGLKKTTDAQWSALAVAVTLLARKYKQWPYVSMDVGGPFGAHEKDELLSVADAYDYLGFEDFRPGDPLPDVFRSIVSAVIQRHGQHIGQQGTPEGGSQPGYTHVPGSVPGSGEAKSGKYELPASMTADSVGRRLFFHGTLIDHLESIDRHGLLPQVGEWVSDVYLEGRRPEWMEWLAERLPPEPLVYLAGPQEVFIEEGDEGAEEDQEIQTAYAGDSHAMMAIMATIAQSKIASGEEWRWSRGQDMWPPWEQIRRDGLIVVLDGEDAKDSDVRYVGEEGVSSYSVKVGPDWVDIDPSSGKMFGEMGPESGDYIANGSIRASKFLYGDELMKYIATWIWDYRTGGDKDSWETERATIQADVWFERYEEDIYNELWEPIEEEEDYYEEQSMRSEPVPSIPRRIFVPRAILARFARLSNGWGVCRGAEPGNDRVGPQSVDRIDDLLYQAEKASIGMAGAITSQSEAQAFVDHVVVSSWWKDRSKIEHVIVRYQPSEWAEAFETGPASAIIVIPPARLNQAFICHELVHLLQPQGSKDHGPEFAGLLLEITGRFMGERMAAKLRESFDQYGVVYRHLGPGAHPSGSPQQVHAGGISEAIEERFGAAPFGVLGSWMDATGKMLAPDEDHGEVAMFALSASGAASDTAASSDDYYARRAAAIKQLIALGFIRLSWTEREIAVDVPPIANITAKQRSALKDVYAQAENTGSQFSLNISNVGMLSDAKTAAWLSRHIGPGVHPGTGTEQQVHAGDRVGVSEPEGEEGVAGPAANSRSIAGHYLGHEVTEEDIQALAEALGRRGPPVEGDDRLSTELWFAPDGTTLDPGDVEHGLSGHEDVAESVLVEHYHEALRDAIAERLFAVPLEGAEGYYEVYFREHPEFHRPEQGPADRGIQVATIEEVGDMLQIKEEGWAEGAWERFDIAVPRDTIRGTVTIAGGMDEAMTMVRNKVAPALVDMVRHGTPYEHLLIAHGFLRVSRGGTAPAGGDTVGLTWDAEAGLNDRQRRFVMRLVRETVEWNGAVAYETVNGSGVPPNRQGVVKEWPNNRFVSIANNELTLRSLTPLPAWAIQVLNIRHLGPGPHPGTGTQQVIHGGDAVGTPEPETASPSRWRVGKAVASHLAGRFGTFTLPNPPRAAAWWITPDGEIKLVGGHEPSMERAIKSALEAGEIPESYRKDAERALSVSDYEYDALSFAFGLGFVRADGVKSQSRPGKVEIAINSDNAIGKTAAKAVRDLILAFPNADIHYSFGGRSGRGIDLGLEQALGISLRHLGPGPHPSGSPQSVHAGDGGGTSESEEAKGRRVWGGTRHPYPEGRRLSRLEIGAIGERIAEKAMERYFEADFESMNDGLNNAPIDFAGDSMVVEVKAGLASNLRNSQHWRTTLGEPWPGEEELLARLSKTERTRYYAYKQEQILLRKQEALVEFSKITGRKIKPWTMGVILSTDGKRGDVYAIPGFHARLGWNRYANDNYFIGTFSNE